jgi:TrmH family RNA methyltransferase
MTADGPITSLANPRVKAAVRLRDRRERDASGLTIVDGVREIGRAVDAGVEVVEAFVSDPVAAPGGQNLAVRITAAGGRLTRVSRAVLEKLAFGDRSEGMVAIVRPPTTELADLNLPENPLVVVVEGVEKPGNLGAIVRTADGAGANGLIAADPLTDLFNPNTIRASLGTVFRMPVAAAPSDATLAWLTAHGIAPFATRVDGPTLYTDVDLRGPVAIVLGSEATGLGRAWTDPRVTPIRIPMLGAADSLNVSVAAAVLLYESRRQRT